MGNYDCDITTVGGVARETYIQDPSVAMVHTKVRLFYPLAHVQWPKEKWNMVN